MSDLLKLAMMIKKARGPKSNNTTTTQGSTPNNLPEWFRGSGSFGQTRLLDVIKSAVEGIRNVDLHAPIMGGSEAAARSQAMSQSKRTPTTSSSAPPAPNNEPSSPTPGRGSSTQVLNGLRGGGYETGVSSARNNILGEGYKAMRSRDDRPITAAPGYKAPIVREKPGSPAPTTSAAPATSAPASAAPAQELTPRQALIASLQKNKEMIAKAGPGATFGGQTAAERAAHYDRQIGRLTGMSDAQFDPKKNWRIGYMQNLVKQDTARNDVLTARAGGYAGPRDLAAAQNTYNAALQPRPAAKPVVQNAPTTAPTVQQAPAQPASTDKSFGMVQPGPTGRGATSGQGYGVFPGAQNVAVNMPPAPATAPQATAPGANTGLQTGLQAPVAPPQPSPGGLPYDPSKLKPGDSITIKAGKQPAVPGVQKLNA